MCEAVISNITKKIKDDIQSDRLLQYAEKDLVFDKNKIIVKDISSTALGVNVKDIVLAYNEVEGFVKLYQGVYISNRIIGVRTVKIKGFEVQKELGRPKDDCSFYKIDSVVKISRSRLYLDDRRVKDGELSFFADVVSSL